MKTLDKAHHSIQCPPHSAESAILKPSEMSMLRTWWGGGDGGDKDPPKDPSKDGEKAEPANQWVKGLGGEALF